MTAALLPWPGLAVFWRRAGGFFSFQGGGLPERRAVPGPKSRDAKPGGPCSRECEAVIHYQTCFARLVASGGADPVIALRCHCERDAGYCTGNLH